MWIIPGTIDISCMRFSSRAEFLENTALLRIYVDGVIRASRSDVTRSLTPVYAVYCKCMCVRKTALLLPKLQLVHIRCRPQDKGVIVRARDKLSATVIERTGPHSRCMSLECISTIPITRLFSPDLDRVVVACREQKVQLRVPTHELYILRMSFQYSNTLEFHTFHSFPYPNLFISATSCKIITTCTPRYAFHLAFMAFKACNQFPTAAVTTAGLPNSNSPIETCACNEVADRRPFA